MGRYAQAMKRGGHVGADAGLPAGPILEAFEIREDPPDVVVVWVEEEQYGFDFWRSRWRQPNFSLLWTLTSDPSEPTTTDAQQICPLLRREQEPYEAEIAFCDVAGNLLSQWSAYQTFMITH